MSVFDEEGPSRPCFDAEAHAATVEADQVFFYAIGQVAVEDFEHLHVNAAPYASRGRRATQATSMSCSTRRVT